VYPGRAGQRQQACCGMSPRYGAAMANAIDSKQLLRLARKGDTQGFQAGIRQVKANKLLMQLTDQLDAEKLFVAAEAVYRRLIEQKPKESSYWSCLGFNLYYQQRQPERAEAHFSEAVRNFPDDAGLLFNRGVNLAWGSKRYTEALPYLQAAVEHDPDDTAKRSALTWCLLCVGKRDEGLLLLRRTLQELGDDDDALSTRVECETYRYLLGSEQERNAALRSIARLLPKHATKDWDFEPLIERALRRGHPAGERLRTLARLVNGEGQLSELGEWPEWQAASRPFSWPADVEVPPLLQSLDRFVGPAEGEGISANFSLVHDDDGVAWCGEQPGAARDFAIFGSDADGSVYALWLVPGRDTSRAPVVYLSSDGGEDSFVIAADLRDFLALLGLCLSDLGAYAGWKEPWAKDAIAERKSDDPFSEREKEFRRWLPKELGIAVPTAKQAEELVNKAKATQPAFEQWLVERMGRERH
jgi:tetratricopeptide (TPR) repeat protein